MQSLQVLAKSQAVPKAPQGITPGLLKELEGELFELLLLLDE